LTYRRPIIRYKGDLPVLRQRFAGKKLLALSPGLAVLLSAFLAGAVAAMLIMSVFILAIIVLVLGMFAFGFGRHLLVRRRGPTRRRAPHDTGRG
jgi:hypothetical protein